MADPWAFMIPRPGDYQERPKSWTERNIDPLTQALLGRSTAQAGREVDRNVSYLARALLDGAKFGAQTFGPQADVMDLTEGAQQMGQGVAGLDWRKLLEGATQTAGGALGLLTPGSFGAAQAIFAGPGAKNANMGMLRKAEDLAAGGADARRIWDETGWFKAADGKWRFEIDDSEAFLERPMNAPEGYQRMVHDPLFDAYPDTATKMQQSISPGPYGGRYDRRHDTIVATGETERDRLSAAIHESQHAVSDREGFAIGGSPKEFEDPDARQYAKQLSDALHWRRELAAKKAELPKADSIAVENAVVNDYRILGMMNDLPSEDARLIARMGEKFPDEDLMKYRRLYGLDQSVEPLPPKEIYRRLVDEVMARNAQARIDWSPEQRRSVPPWATEDVPRDKQIVRFR